MAGARRGGVPSHLRDASRPRCKLTLLAALLHERQREITDTLVDLLISTVHRIGARAERKVTEELVSEFRKVAGKENAVVPARRGGDRPARRHRSARWCTRWRARRRCGTWSPSTSPPARPTGASCRPRCRLVHRALPARADQAARGARVPLGSSACQPVIEALALIRRHAAAGSLTYYPAGEHVPAHAGITED